MATVLQTIRLRFLSKLDTLMAKKKRRAKGRGKGSNFERFVCRHLSRWWSGGKSEDIFWRTSGSGAKAKNTGGKHGTGDIGTLDPDGQPLMDLVSIELKRGYTQTSVADLMDLPPSRYPTRKGTQIEQFIDQAWTDQQLAESFAWMLIQQRNDRCPIVHFPYHLYVVLRQHGCFMPQPCPWWYIKFDLRAEDGLVEKVGICGTTLDAWCEEVTARDIRAVCKEVFYGEKS